MSLHIERCHHRTQVRRARRDWFSQAAARWHDAFVVALRHAEGSLR